MASKRTLSSALRGLAELSKIARSFCLSILRFMSRTSWFSSVISSLSYPYLQQNVHRLHNSCHLKSLACASQMLNLESWMLDLTTNAANRLLPVIKSMYSHTLDMKNTPLIFKCLPGLIDWGQICVASTKSYCQAIQHRTHKVAQVQAEMM